MKGGVESFNISIDYHIIKEGIKGKFNRVYLTSKDIDASLLYTDKLFKNVILEYLSGAYKTRTNIINILIITYGENGLPNYPISNIEFMNGESKNVYNFLAELKNQYNDIRIDITLKQKPRLKKNKMKSKKKSNSSTIKNKFKSKNNSKTKSRSTSNKKKNKSKSLSDYSK